VSSASGVALRLWPHFEALRSPLRLAIRPSKRLALQIAGIEMAYGADSWPSFFREFSPPSPSLFALCSWAQDAIRLWKPFFGKISELLAPAKPHQKGQGGTPQVACRWVSRIGLAPL